MKWSAEKEAQKRQSQPKKNQKKGGKRCAGGFQTVDGLVLEQRSPTHIQASIRTSRIEAYIANCMYVHVRI